MPVDPDPAGAGLGPVPFPTSLCGRDRELSQLRSAFAMAADGTPTLVRVAGPAGMGKTSLLQAACEEMAKAGALVAVGKCDQQRRSRPYAVVLEALEAWCRQVVTGSADDRERWRGALDRALAPNAGALAEIVAGVADLLGPVTPVAPLPPRERQHRFERTVSLFVQTAASPEQPLVLCLDDLQWADLGTCGLLERALFGGDARHLLVLAAYRDDEVSSDHPLRPALDDAGALAEQVATVEVAGLTAGALTELLATALDQPAVKVRRLAHLIGNKTAGNPFFVREFCRRLVDDGFLRRHGGAWSWEDERVRAADSAENVVALLTRRIAALDDDARHLLARASLLGSPFDLETLAVATDLSVAAAWRLLRATIRDGYVVALGGAARLTGVDLVGDEDAGRMRARFAHDRIQQAALEAAGGEAGRLAAEAGERIQRRWPPATWPDRIFDVLRLRTRGDLAALADEDRVTLAELSLRAARRAHAEAAFDAARRHAELGLELLPSALVSEGTLALHFQLLEEATEAAYLVGDFDAMERGFAAAVALADDELATVRVHEIRVEALNAAGRPLDALAHALDVLARLGVSIPAEPTMADVTAELEAAAALLGARPPEALAEAADLDEPAIRAAVTLICKIYSSAYVASPLIFAVVALRQFQLVVGHGNCAVSALSYAIYGLLQAGLVGDVATAYAFGSLSDKMLDRPDIKRYEAQARHLFSCHTRMWREPLAACADGERAAFRVGMQTGEMEFGCYGAHVACKYALFAGQPLGALRREMEAGTAAMVRAKQDLARQSHLPWHQAVVNLTENLTEVGGAAHRLRGPILDAPAARPALEAAKDRMAISNTLTAELLLAVIFEAWDAALARGEEGEAYLDAVLSQFNQPLHRFCHALARLERWHVAAPEDREAHLDAARAAQAALASWARMAPANFAAKAALLSAMLREIDGSGGMRPYEDAIDVARTHGMALDEALGCEAAARAAGRAGDPARAAVHRRAAHAVYERWGATAKAATIAAG